MRVEKAVKKDQPDVSSGYSHVQCNHKNFTPLVLAERLNGRLANR